MASQETAPYPGFKPYATDAYPQQAPMANPQLVPMANPQQALPPYSHQQVPVAPYPQQVLYPQGGAAYPSNQQQLAFSNQGFVPPPAMHPSAFYTEDVESGKDLTADWTGFSNKAIRALFVRKVYAILMLQLAFSFGVVCLFVFEPHVNLFVRRNIFAYFIAYIVFLGVYIALACCGDLRRKYPTNVVMLSLFTISMSYMLGVISSYHSTEIVLMAVGICAAICLLVSLFSFHTKFDFTSCGGVLFVLCWVLFLFGIIAIFTYDRILNTVYAGCGALLFVAFLAYDTQMIMGGKKHEMDPEEHIFAAICLYLDVVYIFMFLLMALGGKK